MWDLWLAIIQDHLLSSIGRTLPLALMQNYLVDQQASYSILCFFCLHHVYKS
jgi:hypothetical protein